MNAVLVELGQPDDPIAVYQAIQKNQNTDVLSGCKTYDFLHNPAYIQNGTLMSLPSGICAAFKNYVTDRIVTVCYNSNFAGGPFKDFIDEEINRIVASGMTVNSDSDFPKTDWTYVLILVHWRHWIAVKKEKDSFTCYDPATGKEEKGNSVDAALQKSGYTPESINGLYLYICIL